VARIAPIEHDRSDRDQTGTKVSNPTDASSTDAIRSSRLWALLTLHVTAFIFPMRMYGDNHGISTVTVGFWLTPWAREEQHLPMSQVAEVRHDRGLIWDTIAVESSGGLNPLTIMGLNKSRASAFIQRLRSHMGPGTVPPTR
jgi:hypothetical protein